MLLRSLLVLVLSILPLSVSAEVLVLIQGYNGGDGWRHSGVTDALQGGGWIDAGHLHDSPKGVVSSRPDTLANRRFYTLALPTGAPLLVQLEHLERYIGYIRARHSRESLYMAGHSAGGVLGRLYMVHHPDRPVAGLITIASPHLGTGTAELGAVMGDTPLAWFAPLLGAEELYQSQGLYRDLVREQPGSLLFWLNRQPHPASRYISVVRGDIEWWSGSGDWFVPSDSQDMNNVMALHGRAQTIVTRGNHGLQHSDGVLLMEILGRLQSS